MKEIVAVLEEALALVEDARLQLEQALEAARRGLVPFEPDAPGAQAVESLAQALAVLREAARYADALARQNLIGLARAVAGGPRRTGRKRRERGRGLQVPG